MKIIVDCGGQWCNFLSGVVVIDDQPEVTIDDPAFLYENNDGFQEVTSKKALKIKLKQEAELLKKTEQQQQKKRDSSNKVGSFFYRLKEQWTQKQCVLFDRPIVVFKNSLHLMKLQCYLW